MVSTCGGGGFKPYVALLGRKEGAIRQLSRQPPQPTQFAPLVQEVGGIWWSWSDLFHQLWDEGVQHFASAEKLWSVKSVGYALRKNLRPWMSNTQSYTHKGSHCPMQFTGFGEGLPTLYWAVPGMTQPYLKAAHICWSDSPNLDNNNCNLIRDLSTAPESML